MKFNSNLTEATLLKRSLRFLAEVVLSNQQRLMIRCPNLGKMLSCDILGTKVMFSSAVGYHCLPTWELAEVDGGHLVGINQEIIKPLIIEAIKNGNIEELKLYQVLHSNEIYGQASCHNLLLEGGSKEQCYVSWELVTLGDDRGHGYFPELPGGGNDVIDYLLQVKKDGHRAILFYCALHTGIDNIMPAKHIDPEYSKRLQKAVAEGVELVAYKASISLQNIELTTQLPVLLSEDAISR